MLMRAGLFGRGEKRKKLYSLEPKAPKRLRLISREMNIEQQPIACRQSDQASWVGGLHHNLNHFNHARTYHESLNSVSPANTLKIIAFDPLNLQNTAPSQLYYSVNLCNQVN
ncbi:unnamed protein product [Victoria cruziana]